MKRVFALLSGAFFLAGGVSFAHEGEEHGHHHDAQMAKMHKMMPLYAKSQARIDAALEKGDVATVAKETGYLLSTAADLKKAKPHKRLKEIKGFRKIAETFEMEVKKTSDLARSGDIVGAEAAFSKAQQMCSSCHEKFRD